MRSLHTLTGLYRLTKPHGTWSARCSCGVYMPKHTDPIAVQRAHDLHLIDEYHAEEEGRPVDRKVA